MYNCVFWYNETVARSRAQPEIPFYDNTKNITKFREYFDKIQLNED